jgi:hypothetical protein
MAKSDEVEKRIQLLERELTDSAQIVQDMVARQKKVSSELKNLRNQLSQIKKPKRITVTDHVILHYAERHYKLPIDQIRQEIMEKLNGAETLKDIKYCGFIVKDNAVVTYVPTVEDKANQ